ncbi:MAG: metal-dependent transcriptional regulator [Thermoproteota archaeon]|nr:MAG: metal-dependent transcriptional regulator [Candidatus Korarchaeota archaeon]RLG55814.1 MAG: metal-dependent transcriptional regulator [Candidatus Korarchaeota archaeon]
MLSEKVEEYLGVIYRLELEGKRPRTTEIAKMLGVSPSSVTAMLQRLASEGLVEYESYKGVKLTEKGKKAAARVLRRHRLAERLLTDILGVSLEDSHEEACRLEHVISLSLERKIADKLGNPDTCPHGNPIPTEDGEVAIPDDLSLSEIEPPAKVVVTRLTDENKPLLSRLVSLGILPGEEIQVKARAFKGAPVIVSVRGSEIALGNDVASKIRVAPPHRRRYRRRRGWRGGCLD